MIADMNIINDGTVNIVPNMVCPYCYVPFTAMYHDLSQGKEMPCEECDNIMAVDVIQIIKAQHVDSDTDGSDSVILVTLKKMPKYETTG